MRRFAVVVAVLATACATTPSPGSAKPVPVVGGCAPSVTARVAVHNAGSGLARALVPGRPVFAVICRYSPLGGIDGPHVVHGALYAHVQVQAGDATRLATLLNAIPRTLANHSCPAEIGRYDVLHFDTPGRPIVTVLVSNSGCSWVTNGVRRLVGAFALLNEELDRLAPGRSVVYARPNVGTLTGRLLAVGGPAGHAPTPLAGDVVVRDRHGPVVIVRTLDGAFTVELGPGTYTVSGSSSVHQSGEPRCAGSRPATVTRGHTVSADVSCQER